MPFRHVSRPVIVAATLMVAGCGISVASTSAFDGMGGESPGTVLGGDASSGGSSVTGPDGGQRVDAAATNPKQSPLCPDITPSTCNPNESNTANEGGTPTEKCTSLLNLDAGDGGPYACHVAKVNGNVEFVCLAEGQSRESCVSPQSCTAGYECIGEDTGTCRRYCCDFVSCDSASFCDPQPIFKSSDVKVPVCMPIAQCKLLSDGCPNQTCAVVDEQRGLTSCVDVGPRGVGDECETDHCAKDLVCLGTMGSRKCFKLCDMTGGASMYDCPSGQHCKANSVIFPTADNVGICQ
jgi:hypothetical protein